jgi:hypothetical protein
MMRRLKLLTWGGKGGGKFHRITEKKIIKNLFFLKENNKKTRRENDV